jgi:hypothetical protein
MEKMMLEKIQKGRINKPARILVYGVDKIGKSTFAADAPNPIFLCAEDGSAELDVARLPEPTSFQEVLSFLGALLKEPHEYQTFVVDTADWLAPLIHAEVIAKAPPDKTGRRPVAIDDASLGFGKGINAAVDLWRVLLARLGELREKRGMHVIMLAHAVIKPFKNPEGDDYDRYELKISRAEGGLLKEWSDAVMFAKQELLSVASQAPGARKVKIKGISDGTRYLFTQWCPAYEAGNRYNLPDRIPLDWDAFWEAKTANTGCATPDAIKAEILQLVDGNDEYTERAATGLAACKDDLVLLTKLLNKVRAAVK